MSDECEHGHLARKCDLCCRDREIARLTVLVGRLADALNGFDYDGHGMFLRTFGLVKVDGVWKEIEDERREAIRNLRQNERRLRHRGARHWRMGPSRGLRRWLNETRISRPRLAVCCCFTNTAGASFWEIPNGD